MSNLVEILVSAKDLTGPAMASVNAKVNGVSKGMATFHKTAMLAGAGFAAIGFEAVKMASKFDSEMTLLNTQAGVSKDKVKGLSQGVLDLAGTVAQNPDSLAESLFHVESNFESMGITSQKALALTKTAAKGATVGHANLVDVTNALTAAVASGIPGVQNFDQAMGILNATVGVGDMKMSDLASAFGTGMVATVKGYGLSITDVSAGLAVFGDNNIRGAKAATQLRMSVQALATPAVGGAAALQKIGLQTDSLAKDMQKGGLKLALEDLVAHMNAAGVASDQQGQIITEAFGKKAGTGLNILVDQIDRLESKYPALKAGAMGFEDAWKATTQTAAFQAKALQSSFDALMIEIGQKLIPPLQSLLNLLTAHKAVTMGAVEATLGLLGAVVLVSAAMKTAAAATKLWAVATKTAAGATSMFETAALKAMYMNDAFIAAGGGARGLSAAIGTLGTGTKVMGAIAVVAAIALVAKHFSDEAKQAHVSADQMATSLKGVAAGNSGATSKLMQQLSKDSADLHQSLGQKLKSNDSVWDLVTNGGAKTTSANKDFKEFGQTLADMVKNGDSTRAALALKNLTAAGEKVPTKYLDAYRHALADTEYESELTAQSQGKFGKQAQDVQAALDVQASAAEGLAQSLQALDQVNQDAYGSQTKMESSIDAATQALKDNGKTLDIHSEKGRSNRDALQAVASDTDAYTEALVKQGASWDTVNGAYMRGYNSLVKNATAMYGNRDAAVKLANSLLHVPDEVKIGANINDLEAKLKSAKSQLKSVPTSKRAAVQANINDLEAKVARAKWDLAQLGDKNVTVTTFLKSVYSGPQLGGVGGHAGGGMAGMGETSWVGEQGPELMQVTPLGTRIFSNTDSKKLAKINGIKVPGYAKGTLTKAQQAAIDQANSEHAAARDAMSGLGISYFGRVAGGKGSAFQTSVSSGASSVGDLGQTLNEWRSKIGAATHGTEESRLVASFDKFGAAALKNEKALVSVNSKLDAAKDKLSSLKDSFAQLRDSVASSVTAYGSVAKSNTGQPGGAGSVISQLQADTATAKRFAADLATLKKKGLNSQSLSELAGAGIDGGGLENAERLLGSSKTDIKTINSLEAQLKAAGTAAGTTTADSMYGAGISQAQGLVNGLAKQQSNLNKIMANAAAAMASQLKKSLGGKASGGTVGAAATGGNRWGRTLVGEYAPEIVDLPIGSRVHSGPDTQRMLGAGGQPFVIHAVFQIDGRTVAEQLLEPTRDMVQRMGGGDVQKVFGGRVR